MGGLFYPLKSTVVSSTGTCSLHAVKGSIIYIRAVHIPLPLIKSPRMKSQCFFTVPLLVLLLAICVNAKPIKLNGEVHDAQNGTHPSHLQSPHKMYADRLVFASVRIGVGCEKEKRKGIPFSTFNSGLEDGEISSDGYGYDKEMGDSEHKTGKNEYQEDEEEDEHNGENLKHEKDLNKGKPVHGVEEPNSTEHPSPPSHDNATKPEDLAENATVPNGSDLSTSTTESTTWKMKFYTYRIY
ncbi:hypothetical protein TSMEX_008286 [Taenia solium]|eukprot:TsM_000594600 transcript=TsM_000594600 gene=TsM_000594600